MSVDRPYVVLDCSNVERLDRSVVEVLLCCLEEAIKRNGDVKLASIPSGAEAILELTGVNRLFEILDTAAGAVHSFYSKLVLEVRGCGGAPMHGVARCLRAAKSSAAGLRWSFLHAQSIGGFEGKPQDESLAQAVLQCKW